MRLSGIEPESAAWKAAGTRQSFKNFCQKTQSRGLCDFWQKM
uniref:Uncharacterized protein n=1 Tax=Strongyloides papillosus TaxID=174720 RepID=A0A0N5C6G3_STREA